MAINLEMLQTEDPIAATELQGTCTSFNSVK